MKQSRYFSHRLSQAARICGRVMRIGAKKTLTVSLIVSILFINAFILPRVAFAQTAGSLTPPTRTAGTLTPASGANAGASAGTKSTLPPGSILPSSATTGAFQYVDENGMVQTVGGAVDQGTGGGAAGGASAGGVAGGAAQCAVGTLLGNILATSIRNAISNFIGGTVANAAVSIILPRVPVEEKGQVGQHIVGDARAHSGSYTIGATYTGVSWDAVAWCIVNAMIEQIANSTIAWANSGFNGKPAFIQNPDRFFKSIADKAAGSIIRDIAYGATGVNVCQPFRVNIAIGLAQNYSGTGGNGGSAWMTCGLSDITSGRFFGGVTTSVGGSKVSTAARPGNITWDDWISVTQNDKNNPYGATIAANQAFYAGVSRQQNSVQLEVGMNNGWLNFKKCKDPNDSKTCDIVTPGRLIESQLNSTLDQSKNRLVMAQKFDQMITAIVNNLIKVALNKVLTK